jgi:hypothetical protein
MNSALIAMTDAAARWRVIGAPACVRCSHHNAAAEPPPMSSVAITCTWVPTPVPAQACGVQSQASSRATIASVTTSHIMARSMRAQNVVMARSTELRMVSVGLAAVRSMGSLLIGMEGAPKYRRCGRNGAFHAQSAGEATTGVVVPFVRAAGGHAAREAELPGFAVEQHVARSECSEARCEGAVPVVQVHGVGQEFAQSGGCHGIPFGGGSARCVGENPYVMVRCTCARSFEFADRARQARALRVGAEDQQRPLPRPLQGRGQFVWQVVWCDSRGARGDAVVQEQSKAGANEK